MSQSKSWSRRNFVQLVGTAAIASRASGLTRLVSPPGIAPLEKNAVLFVGCRNDDSEAIEVLAVRNGRLTSIQRLGAAQPVAMTTSRDQQTLYVVNGIDQFEGLPRGTVEAYSIGSKGQITLLNRQPLSLSATRPNHVALSADGNSLIVTAQAGGILNHLPILSDGSIGRVDGIFKLTGSADGRMAQPRMTLFDSEQRLVNLDSGTGTVRVIRKEGIGLMSHDDSSFPSKTPAQHMEIGHKTKSLYVASSDGIDVYAYDSDHGSLMNHRQRVDNSADTLKLHPSEKMLFSSHPSDGFVAWHIGQSGKLRRAAVISNEVGSADLIELSADGKRLFTLSSSSGTISTATIDSASGTVGKLDVVAKVNAPKSVALISL